MGVARLSRVTVILPRGDYQEALTYLSQFEEFHRISSEQGAFDPATEGLAVRAVRLFAQTDQAVKSLSLPLSPPMLDVIFRGVSVPETVYEAARWNELLDKAEDEARPIVEAVNGAVGRLAQLEKDEQDTRALSEALRSVAGLSVDLGKLGQLKRMNGVVAIAEKDTLDELRSSLSDLVFVAQPLRGSQSVVLVAGPTGDAGRIEKVLRTLEVSPIVLPSDLPQNPPEAFRSLVARAEELSAEKRKAEEEVEKLTAAHSEKLLACRELANVAHQMLDEVRNSGKLKRMAILSGYIPASREGEFRERFGRWMVYVEQDGHHLAQKAQVPTLVVNRGPTRSFSKVTESQGTGTPAKHEIDPTPIISLVFPIFFGMMFGDLGHGIVVTAFGLLLRSRSDRNLRQWGTIFATAGVSASVFGVLFGEFFGFSTGQFLPIPAVIDIVQHAASNTTLNQEAIITVISIAILIGVAHITFGLSLSVYQAARAHESLELALEKIPALVLYLGGIAFGLAFIGAGYSFKGVPSTPLGLASLVVVTPALLIIGFGKGVATLAGRLHEDSAAMAFVQGIIEILIRISEFVANTISYARLAILLLVHSALLLALNKLYYNFASDPYIVVFPMIVFNVLILLLEGTIVYIQDLRLHLYEWFTKFYTGEGVPFRRILPERERIRIKWL